MEKLGAKERRRSLLCSMCRQLKDNENQRYCRLCRAYYMYKYRNSVMPVHVARFAKVRFCSKCKKEKKTTEKSSYCVACFRVYREEYKKKKAAIKENIERKKIRKMALVGTEMTFD